jgi:gliding motility-associated-like protein
MMLLSTFVMKRIILYISLLLSTLFSYAQKNLISNGGFEEQLIKPTGFLPSNQGGQSLEFEDIITHWTVPTKGSPDVFLVKNTPNSDDAVGIPIRWKKYSEDYEKEELVYPATGNGFIGLVSGIYIDNMSNELRQGTEAVQANLSGTLEQKRRYEMTLQFRISQKSNSDFGNLGIHFSTESILNNFDTSDDDPELYRFGPLLKEYIPLIVGDTIWTNFKVKFRPTQNFQYVTIGCFNIQSHQFERDTFISTYYFIDDVSLIEIPCLVGQDTACKGDQVTYYSTFSGPFSWDHNGVEVSTDSIYTFTADEGWYYLKTPNGEDSLYLTVLDELENIEDVNDTICAGESVQIDLPSQYQYVWQDGSTSNDRVFTDPISQYIQVSSKHCFDTLSLSINWYPQTTAYPNFLYQFCRDSSKYIEHNSGPTSEQVIWSDGFIGGVRKLYDEGNYTYDIIDSNGCSSGAIVSVEELCPSNYWIPNAFAPDGVNKTFKPYLKDVSEATLIIYNRWGEKIYEQTAQEPEWDGTYQNKHCQQGVYFYTLTLKSEKNNIIDNLKGVIQLIR